LSPSNIKKSGSKFDLGMAIGLLLKTNQIEIKDIDLKEVGFIGELSLDGNLRSCKGILPMVMKAKEEGMKRIILPRENVEEALLISDIEIIGIDNLKNVVEYLSGKPVNILTKVSSEKKISYDSRIDFKDVKGQKDLINYIKVAVAGGHNIIMTGSPGCGKSMIAKRIPTILPQMSQSEALEVTKIYSVVGTIREGKLVTERPFRSPHHNASTNSLIGGGRTATPGEITLAHNGVLFLDEIPQFDKRTLDALRQPMEDGTVTISRVDQTNEYPSRFMLVAAMNPCPCGYYGEERCKCTDYEVLKYRKKISGPIMDRIDIQKYVSPIDLFKELDDSESISSKELRNEIEIVREIQNERFKDYEGVNCNAQMDSYLINKFCDLDQECKDILRKSYKRFKFSARSYNKYLKVARTFADFENHENIQKDDLLNALTSRDMEKEESNMMVM
ncbi:MAG: YifB family Mg chelatase-like AAA ATPase, partial [Clostridiales bacterium]|nr:YifB family Mg chelatase-like AAA ATPase [Clostridiales bacterium]